MPATTTTTELFPRASVSLAQVQNEQRLRIKAGAIRSVIDDSDPTNYVLRTEWNVLGENDDTPPPLAQQVVPGHTGPADIAAMQSPGNGFLGQVQQNVADLAHVIMSEASVGNTVERLSVAHTVLNRMSRSGSSSIREVWRAYARAQSPTPAIISLAQEVIVGGHVDPTSGSTHFYSPRSMPKEGDSTVGFDIASGLELVPPLTVRTYVPSWAKTMEHVDVSGVRPDYFKFFRP